MFLPAALAGQFRFVDAPYYYALLRPVDTTLFICGMSRPAHDAIRNSAIECRGARYPLHEPKRNVAWRWRKTSSLLDSRNQLQEGSSGES